MKRTILVLGLFISAFGICEQKFNTPPFKSEQLLYVTNEADTHITPILFRGLKIKTYNEAEFNQIIVLLKMNKNATCAIYIDKQNNRVIRENKLHILKVIDLIHTKIDTASIQIEAYPTKVHNFQFDPIFGGDRKHLKLAQSVIYIQFVPQRKN